MVPIEFGRLAIIDANGGPAQHQEGPDRWTRQPIPCPVVKPGLLVQLLIKEPPAPGVREAWPHLRPGVPETIVHQWTADEFNAAITTDQTVSGKKIWEIQHPMFSVMGRVPRRARKRRTARDSLRLFVPLEWPKQEVTIMRRRQMIKTENRTAK